LWEIYIWQSVVLDSLSEPLKTSPGDSSRAAIWLQIGGPLLVVVAAAAIELSRGVFTIPNPPAILLLIVVFAAFIGGLRSGLVTALMLGVVNAHTTMRRRSAAK
jgi:hypothetical protein